MPTRDTAQLILEVDARIATAQRAVNQLARSIQSDAGGIDNSLKKIEQSTERVGKSLGAISSRTRSGFTQLSFQIGDVTQGLAMGTKASTIFAQQSGQVIQALQIMGGEGNKFLQFLGGPWGLAISTAVVILGTLGSKLFDSGSELDKLVAKMRDQAKQADLNRQAEEIWSHSLDGLIDRQKELNKQLEQRLKNQTAINKEELAQAQRNQQAAQNTVKRLENTPGASATDIAKAQQALTNANRDLISAQILAGRQLGEEMADLSERAKAYEDRFSDAQAAIQRNHPELAQRDPAAKLSESYQQLKKAIDAAAAAGVNFDNTTREADKLNDKLLHGTVDVAAYSAQIKALASSLQVAAKAAKDANKDGVSQFKSAVIGAEGTGPNKLGSSAAGFGQFMPSTWLGYFNKLFPDKQALSDAAKLGFRNVREVANAVIDKATDDYVNVLKAAGQGINAANLYAVHLLGAGDAKKLFAAAPGTDTSQFLSSAVLKGNPFLRGTAGSARAAIGKRIGDSSSAVSSGAASIDKTLSDEAEKAADRFRSYQAESDRLDADLLDAKSKLLDGANAEADAKIADLKQEQVNYNKGIDRQVADDKLGDIEGSLLKLKHDELTAEKIRQVNTQLSIENLKRADELEQRSFQYRADDLRFADELASTQGEHRRIQLEILDVVYQQKEAHLRALKAELELAGKIEEAADIQAQIDRLPTEKSQDRTRTEQGTMNPLEAWAHDIPKTAAEVNEALQSIEAKGLDNLSSAIADVIGGTKSLKDAFGDLAKSIIADIIQMSVKMLVFRAISSVLGSAFGGGGASAGDIGGINSVLGGGSGAFTFGLTPRAGGGNVRKNVPYLVGERRPEVFVPSSNGTILPSVPNMKGFGGSSAAPQRQIVELHLKDEMLEARITDGATVQILRTYPAMKADTIRTMREGDRRSAR